MIALPSIDPFTEMQVLGHSSTCNSVEHTDVRSDSAMIALPSIVHCIVMQLLKDQMAAVTSQRAKQAIN